ncbi:class I SAM-dependent methyltransferase [Niabella insulamsoli]|uniref:class I SAM-dependent methyltransferase n=1 Tax=Niabella insulamsoli TaxID=3144874 RepID=UPI0031FD016C
MKWNLHRMADPLEGGLLNLAYMSKLSKWRQANVVTGYNDWYQQNWDYSRRIHLYESILQNEGLNKGPVDYMEFGVSSGASFRWWLQHQTNEASRFFGFDTFEGLPEAFGAFEKGAMAATLESIGVTDIRATFYKGLFQDTLLPFLDQYKRGNRKLIHMDADLFSATIFVLSQLYRFLNDGDIIMFDEFAVPTHEFRAFQIFADSFYIQYEVIAAANNYLFLAVKIKK